MTLIFSTIVVQNARLFEFHDQHGVVAQAIQCGLRINGAAADPAGQRRVAQNRWSSW